MKNNRFPACTTGKRLFLFLETNWLRRILNSYEIKKHLTVRLIILVLTHEMLYLYHMISVTLI